MSQTRDEVKSKSNPIESAFIATAVVHPIRVNLSRAQNDFWPWMTAINGWKAEGWRLLVKGFPINLARGTGSTATAAFAKQLAGTYVTDKHPWVATATMLTAASFAEMVVAYACETWFIRRSNLDANNMLNGVKFSPHRFTPALLPLYFVRGLGFNSVVLFSKHLPPEQENPILIAGTIFSAASQKFINGVATSDIEKHKGKGIMPDFKEGMLKTLRNVARGDVYTHASYKGYYMNPASFTKQVANLFYVGCTPSMFCWRLGYLYSVKYVFNMAEEKHTSVLSKVSLFARHESYLMTDSEKELMRESGNYRAINRN